jgi:hypothetical protein
MKYLRRQNINSSNILDQTVLQTADGNIELNPTHRVVINGDVDIIGGAVPGPEVTNVMYVTMDGNDSNTGFGEGSNQAKRSIKSAVEAAQEGTTIFVRSGEYYEDNPIRLPPKVSIIGDNLRRTILRPLNGPIKFNVVSIQRTDGIVTLVTDQPHEFQLHDRVRVIITDPSGASEVDDECANIIEISSTTSFKYKDFGENLPLTLVNEGIVEKGFDFFLVSNQSYIAQLVFKGLQAPAYCINVDKDAIVDTSPYIQNCSNINGPWMRNGVEWLPFITEQPDLTGTMVKGPRPLKDEEIDPLQLNIYGINERGAGGGMLIDGDRYNSESPIKSMVADAFTQVAQGAVGFHITNFGYMQLVSCFNVFCDKAYLTTKGGYVSISNSVCDFGNYGFYADGYYPIPYNKGTIIADYYSTLGSVTVNDIGSGYTSAPTVTVQPPDPSVAGGIQATAIAFIDIFKGTVTAVAVDNPGFGYTFEPTITIGPPITGSIDWLASLTVTTSDIIKYDRYFYQITVAGTLGSTPPNDGLAPQVNGTATLQRIANTATATANLAKNGTITVHNLSSKPQIASIMFLGDDPIGYYITDTLTSNLGFTYNETKCRRDVGYITEAVLADAVFNTEFRSTYAGLAYLRSYSSKVTSLQKAETIDGINQAKNYILAIPSVALNATMTSRINNNFTIVTNIIQNGASAAPIPTLNPLVGQTAGLSEAAQILLANKEYIKDEVVAYINSNFNQVFSYDQVKCSRDVGIILESVLSDLILGTNYLSKISGLSYLRSYTNEVNESQKKQTIDGINRAKDLAIQLITDLDAIEIIKTNFEIVKTIIQEGSKTAAPISNYTNPIGASSGQLTSARQLEINRNFIVEEIVAFVKDTFNTSNIIGYNENTCRRDTEYIVDALIFDLLYAGNSATRIIAQSFYDEDGNNVVGNQITEHVAAFTRLKTVVGFVIQGSTAWTKSASNPLTQNTTLGSGTLTSTTQGLIDIVINSIQSGLLTIPAEVLPTYTSGSLYSYYNDERTRILTDKTNIQNSVIEYLNEKYLANFTYDETTCRRDIGYIIDAISYDLTYGGNTQTSQAGLAYSDYNIVNEIEATQFGFEYWKNILPYILQNQDVPNAYATGQVKTSPLGSPVPENYPSSIAQNLLQIIIDVVDHGQGYIPEPVTNPRFELSDSGLNFIRLTVLDNILSIEESTIEYLNLTYGGNIDVKVFPGVISVEAGTEVRFHNVSTISTGGTALEYVGAGITYNALPFFGGEPVPANERVEVNNGKCFTVTNDQVGNFRVGGLFTVNALTGAVTINANQLSLQGLASIGPFIRDGIPVGVEVREISNNTNLIASNGLQDINTVPTQFAVSNYVEDRYLNKVQSTTPQTVESVVTFTNGTGSTSPTSGTVIIDGGVGVSGQLWVEQLRQTSDKVAIGADAGVTNQGNSAVALGDTAGNINQSSNAVAIGNQAGQSSQSNDAIAIGREAGQTTQSSRSVAIGLQAGEDTQSTDAVAIGYQAGQITQGLSSVAVGIAAGKTSQGNYAVAIGNFAGETAQGIAAVAIGDTAGLENQGNSAVAIGVGAGETTQNNFAVAIGLDSGNDTQGTNAVAIGSYAGEITQGSGAVAIGVVAGSVNQGTDAVAIGDNAGQTNQGVDAIAIGRAAASTGQGANAIAIGSDAGSLNQGANAIAIGNNTGETNQTAGSIIINATGLTLNSTTSGLYISPVRDEDTSTTTDLILFRNSTTSEINKSTKFTIQPSTGDVKINSTTDTTDATTGALQVAGGVMVAKDLFVGGADIITDQTTFNVLTTPATINAFNAATDVNIANVGTAARTIDIATAATAGASILTFGGAVTGNTFEINSVAAGTINLSSDVTTGTVNLYTGLTTGIMNIGSAALGKLKVEFTTNPSASDNTTGALVVAGGIGVGSSGIGDIVGAGFDTNSTTGAITTIYSKITDFVIDEGEY